MIRFLLVIAFFFSLLMFLMGFSVVRSFKRALFGNNDGKNRRTTHSATNQQSAHAESKATTRKKIFSKEEGEYVDYEEVK